MLKTQRLICAGLSICFVAVFAKGQIDSLVAKSDAEVINQLSLQRGAAGVSDEIVHRGARMIPLLLKVKGDRRPAYTALGFHLSAFATQLASDPSNFDPERVLTMEVAALYLICAIYHNSTEFAQAPYLTDQRLPAEKRRGLNTPDLVARAWQSVEEWSKRADVRTIQKLRERKDDPLKGSGVEFW